MEFNIRNKKIGGENPVFIVAEMSGNHNQDYDIAMKTIHAIKESGADAVKLQTYTPDTITIDVDNEYFRINQGTIWDGKTLYQLYKEAYTPWDWQPRLKKLAEELGLECFSTPFDKTAVDFLENMNVEAYKIASFEITDLPLIEYVAKKNKPIIFSTGIAEIDDIDEAVKICRNCDNTQIAILKCTSAYPAPYRGMNLNTIPDIAERFNVVAGLSDHTLGISAAVTATALGARIIEKHFILDRKLGGPDASFSLEPDEFSEMVKSVRAAEDSVGVVDYELTEQAKNNRAFARSLFAVNDIKSGEIFTKENIRSIRPGYGIMPKYIDDILGKKAKKDITKGTPIKWELVI